ncbi:hypothetical protein VTK26DRAFT_8822 [Humicola hyalothermophila]
MASEQQKPAVSFIGLGAMGFGMATHLVKQGYAVTGFDVWPPARNRFEQAGGATASTPAAAVANKPFCVCMVATADQAQAVFFDGPDAIVPALPQGATLLLCSTVPCDYVQSLERQLASVGRGDILLVDSPVSGGASRAADGTLSIMAGMSDAALAAARPLLEEMADPKKLYIVRGGVGAGSNMKMVHQVLAACQILAASEAMGFAVSLGLDMAKAQQAILASDAWSWFFEHRSPRMFPGVQEVASAVNIIAKDTGIIMAEARRSRFPTPMTGMAEQFYLTTIGKGYGRSDDSSLVRLYLGERNADQLPPKCETEEEKLALVIDLHKAILLCSAAESLSFANFVGLDLDQVFDLCINAAGASTMLQQYGPALMDALRAGAASKEWTAKDSTPSVQDLAERLHVILDEARRIKAPVYLGYQASELFRQALKFGTPSLAIGALVNVWA